MVTVVFVVSCGGNKSQKASTDLVNNPMSATDTAPNMQENAPFMTFEENIHNFGILIDGEVVTYKFKFKNTGNVDLIINSASASCGCTVPSYSREPIKPGEESAIDVQFNSSGKVGKFDKSVSILSNTIPPQTTLLIEGEVKPK